MTCPILQFGTSRFLQAHVDLFVSEALAAGAAAGRIAVVQTTNSAESRRRIKGFRSMSSFPVLLRGLRHGEPVDRRVEVNSIARAWNAADDWPAVTAHFVGEARFIVSNTGDRGYQLDPTDRPDSLLPRSFPAKLLTLLQARFRAGGVPLILLPCELISNNASTLRDLIAGLARSWQMDPAFIRWLTEDCRWLNSLVDRIVSEALEPAGAVAEPYALWAIEAQPGVALPCAHPDVKPVADLVPYERLKLFILNLGHTLLAERWLAENGPPDETVATALQQPAYRDLLLGVYAQEVLPVFVAIGMGVEAASYRDTVLDRFANPYLRHRLADIANNHTAKKQRRIKPLLALAREAGALHPTPVLSAIEDSGVGGQA